MVETDGSPVRYRRLALDFNAPALARDLAGIAAREWVAHFNTGYYDGGWSGVTLRGIDGDARLLFSGDFTDCSIYRHPIARPMSEHRCWVEAVAVSRRAGAVAAAVGRRPDPGASRRGPVPGAGTGAAARADRDGGRRGILSRWRPGDDGAGRMLVSELRPAASGAEPGNDRSGAPGDRLPSQCVAAWADFCRFDRGGDAGIVAAAVRPVPERWCWTGPTWSRRCGRSNRRRRSLGASSISAGITGSGSPHRRSRRRYGWAGGSAPDAGLSDERRFV